VEPILGTIILFTGDFVPNGWTACDGTVLPIDQFQALYAILGPTYGGDGTTTFGVPKIAPPVPATQYIMAITGEFPVQP
jgi:microcystin-dependent protein